MKKVSFDFDGTLSKNKVQQYAKTLIKAGVECWIVTSRMGFGESYSLRMKSDPEDTKIATKQIFGVEAMLALL